MANGQYNPSTANLNARAGTVNPGNQGRNELDIYVNRLLAMSLVRLRAAAKMPQIVSRNYDALAAQKGSQISIPISAEFAVSDVLPSSFRPDSASFEPTQEIIEMNQWKKTEFELTDKELNLITQDRIPENVEGQIASLADEIDKFILGTYVRCANVVGTAGVPLFNDGTGSAAGTKDSSLTRPITGTMRVLNEEKAPMDMRRIVLNPTAQAAAVDVRGIQDISWGGDSSAIRDGLIDGKFGFNFFMNQNILRHTSGTQGGLDAGAKRAVGGAAVGDVLINITAGAPGDFVVGDVVSFAGHSRTYAVKEYASSTITLWSPLVAAVAATSKITTLASHDVNLGFHRNAIAFVNRPLPRGDLTPGQSVIQTMTDSLVSNLSLRLEVKRENKRTVWELDALYGAAMIRPQNCVRIIA